MESEQHLYDSGHQSTADLDVILQLLESREFDVTDVVARLKQHCPEASQSVMDRANSPEFALPRQVLRVEHAIAVLGHRRLQQTLEKFRRHDAATGIRRPHLPAPGESPATATGGTVPAPR